MRGWALIPAGVMMTAALCADAAGPCGVLDRTVRDPGLHREWQLVTDCAHPERPARLQEIAWEAAAQKAAGTATKSFVPEVQAGMRVEVVQQDGAARVHLVGRALNAGRVGDPVVVRWGTEGAALSCVVRGPARVELRLRRKLR